MYQEIGLSLEKTLSFYLFYSVIFAIFTPIAGGFIAAIDGLTGKIKWKSNYRLGKENGEVVEYWDDGTVRSSKKMPLPLHAPQWSLQENATTPTLSRRVCKKMQLPLHDDL